MTHISTDGEGAARQERIVAYRLAYEAANGGPAPSVHYRNGWYYVGRMSAGGAMRGDALDRAAERLRNRAAVAQQADAP